MHDGYLHNLLHGCQRSFFGSCCFRRALRSFQRPTTGRTRLREEGLPQQNKAHTDGTEFRMLPVWPPSTKTLCFQNTILQPYLGFSEQSHKLPTLCTSQNYKTDPQRGHFQRERPFSRFPCSFFLREAGSRAGSIGSAVCK